MSSPPNPMPAILVVEDRVIMLKILRRLLAQIGYTNVDTTTGVAEAQQYLAARSYDLILSDWNMDGMSGFDFLLSVRSNPATAKIPFVLVTAEAKTENVQAAEAAGASGYLVKPFTLDVFSATINRVLAGQFAPAA